MHSKEALLEYCHTREWMETLRLSSSRRQSCHGSSDPNNSMASGCAVTPWVFGTVHSGGGT